MGKVIFCATDFYLKGGYGSYQDWFRLVELSGYPVIPLTQLDPQSDNTYIVTPLNNEWLQGWRQPRARIIHYELEWRWDWRAEVDEPPGIAEVWAGDKHFAGSIGARYVPIGSHPGLNEFYTPREKMIPRWDVSFMGYRAPNRRASLLHQIESTGLSIAPDAWGKTRSGNLLESACMLAIHQHDNMVSIPPLRLCIAAAHKLAVISERVADAGIFTGMIDHFPYADLANMAKLIVRDPYNRLVEQGLALYDKLCVEQTFRKSIEAAL